MILRRVMNRDARDVAPFARLHHLFLRRASSLRSVSSWRLSALEVNLAPLLAVIGAAGFVVAFALQGTLSNFASGLLIMVFKPFDVGDDVEVGGGIKGKVTHVTIFSTYIRTDDGITKIVPNDNIWKSVIVNETTGVVKSPRRASRSPPTRSPRRRERRQAHKGALCICDGVVWLVLDDRPRRSVRPVRFGLSWLVAVSQRKTPSREGWISLDFLGFLSSETRLINGLRGIFAEKFFCVLFPRSRTRRNGRLRSWRRKGWIAHPPSLPRFPIFRNLIRYRQ